MEKKAKIIFNHTLSDWWIQIYDELCRYYDVILPENYEIKAPEENWGDLNILEKTIKKHPDTSLIFGFYGELDHLIRWQRRKITIPLLNCFTNAINRPHIGKMSIFMNLWYVEFYAKSLMEKYNRENLIYAGMAANPFIFYPLEIEKKFHISFIGRHYGERGYYLKNLYNFSYKNNLKCFFPLGDGVKMFFSLEEINKIYNQSKINISFAPKEPPGRIVNQRTFEICMSGNFQLMQYTPCVEEYFEIDKEIVCWKNKRDLYNKIIYFLENEDERVKIANQGYKRAKENHTWKKRFEYIFQILKNKKKIDFTPFIINTENILDMNKISSVHLDMELSERIIQVLSILGYHKRSLKKKESIDIKIKNNVFRYKLDLSNFYFVKIYGKIRIIIKFANHSEINDNEWNALKKIFYLTENPDSSLARFGIITNGIDWIIRDFKNNSWLSSIPTQKEIKSLLNIKSDYFHRIILKMMKYFEYLNILFKRIIHKIRFK